MTTSTAAATVTSIIRVDSPEEMARKAHEMGMQQMYLRMHMAAHREADEERRAARRAALR